MLNRSGFKRPQREKTRTVHQPIPEHQRRAVSYAGATRPAPKTEPLRNPAIMEMANGRPCLMLIPGVCNGNPETTVAAHSNWSEHGKAGARKADDTYTAWACACCHSWLDQGNTAQAEEKKAAWLAAHRRQVDHWHAIASDKAESPRFQKAALWAINHLTRM